MRKEGKADFMSVHWKAVAIVSSGAFVLSFLTGLVAGVAFGVLLGRAALFAGLFAAGAITSSYGIQRWLPDLLSGETRYETGTHVNLTVGDDDEEPDTDVRPSSDPSRSAMSSVFDESMIEEVEETSTADSPSRAATDGTKPAVSAHDVSEADRDDLDGDELPELDGFAGSFETVGTDAENAVSSDGGASRAVDEYGMDTKTMAEALRTVLKRDE